MRSQQAMSLRAQHIWAAVPPRAAEGGPLRQPRTHAWREFEQWLAVCLEFGEPSRLSALFDHDITRVELDSRLNCRFLMPREHDEPARMRSDACELLDGEIHYPTAIHAGALAHEAVGRLSVARALILDPVVYAPCQGLVLCHPALASIIHA